MLESHGFNLSCAHSEVALSGHFVQSVDDGGPKGTSRLSQSGGEGAAPRSRNINRAISDNLLKDLGEYHWAQDYKLNTNELQV